MAFQEQLNQCLSHIQSGHFSLASDISERLIQEHPENETGFYLQATLDTELEQYDSAIRHYFQCLALRPDLRIARFQLALLLCSLDHLDKAREQLEHLEDPQDFIGLFATGLLAVTFEQTEKALEYLTQGIKQNINHQKLNENIHMIINRIANTPPSQSEPKDNQDQTHLLDIYQNNH